MTHQNEENVEIHLEFDGRILRGQYQLGNDPFFRILVHFNGHTASRTLFEEAANHEYLAMQLFKQLVQDNYTPLDRIDSDLPASIREAAFRYVNSSEDHHLDDEDLLSRALVDSFGDQPVGSRSHRCVSWLCTNVLKSIVSAWCANGEPDPQQTYDKLIHHLRDGVAIVEWDELCRPPVALHDGRRIVDCTACMLEPIAHATASAAKYVRNGEPHSAGEVISWAWFAHDEGAWKSDTLSYPQWVVLVALPAAFGCREIEISSFHS